MCTIYTDGSCLRNPGPGGWAFLVVQEEKVGVEFSGGEHQTTNNRMELQAVISALEFVKVDAVDIYTDSQLVLNCAQGTWKRKANLDMWAKFDAVLNGRQIRWHWVRGHNGDVYNERVDRLARTKALEYI